jgi:putative sigma-54 modulation protein
VRSKKKILRAEERTADIFASIDAIVDKMYTRIMRYKGKLYEKGKGLGEPPPVEYEEEPPHRIVKVKRFQMMPMDEEEAIEQMELLGHSFFVFYNVRTEGINVLYKRRDGDYGLIIPELV